MASRRPPLERMLPSLVVTASCGRLALSAPARPVQREASAVVSAHVSGLGTTNCQESPNLAWLRERNITPRIARPGVESSERLRRHRWKIERSISWLFGYRRMTVRYERKGGHFLAFLGLAAVMTCYKKLSKIAT